MPFIGLSYKRKRHFYAKVIQCLVGIAFFAPFCKVKLLEVLKIAIFIFCFLSNVNKRTYIVTFKEIHNNFVF